MLTYTLILLKPFSKPVSKGTQGFKRLRSSGNNTIGQPQIHLSAIQQATGEAVYTDDLPHYENELYAGLILSEKAHANFTIDSSALDEIVRVCL